MKLSIYSFVTSAKLKNRKRSIVNDRRDGGAGAACPLPTGLTRLLFWQYADTCMAVTFVVAACCNYHGSSPAFTFHQSLSTNNSQIVFPL